MSPGGNRSAGPRLRGFGRRFGRLSLSSRDEPDASSAPGHPVLTELHRFADAWHLTWSQKHDTVRLERIVAERKVMLGTAKLTYRATVTIDEARREVAFSELLAERGTGISSGGDDGEGSGFGFGIQTTSYNTHRDTIANNIEDQARQYSRQYVLASPTPGYERSSVRSPPPRDTGSAPEGEGAALPSKAHADGRGLA